MSLNEFERDIEGGLPLTAVKVINFSNNSNQTNIYNNNG
jgi:hypothetical protein